MKIDLEKLKHLQALLAEYESDNGAIATIATESTNACSVGCAGTCAGSCSGVCANNCYNRCRSTYKS